MKQLAHDHSWLSPHAGWISPFCLLIAFHWVPEAHFDLSLLVLLKCGAPLSTPVSSRSAAEHKREAVQCLLFVFSFATLLMKITVFLWLCKKKSIHMYAACFSAWSKAVYVLGYKLDLVGLGWPPATFKVSSVWVSLHNSTAGTEAELCVQLAKHLLSHCFSLIWFGSSSRSILGSSM